MKRYMIWALVLLGLTACEKDFPEAPEKINTVWVAPLEDAVYYAGDTVRLSADLSTADWTAHGYEIYVYDSLQVHFAAAAHLHQNLYAIDTFFVNRTDLAQEVTVEFRLHLDHSGTRRDQRRRIVLMP